MCIRDRNWSSNGFVHITVDYCGRRCMSIQLGLCKYRKIVIQIKLMYLLNLWLYTTSFRDSRCVCVCVVCVCLRGAACGRKQISRVISFMLCSDDGKAYDLWEAERKLAQRADG